MTNMTNMPLAIREWVLNDIKDSPFNHKQIQGYGRILKTHTQTDRRDRTILCINIQNQCI